MLEHRSDEWDMSGVIGHFPERITTDYNVADYYSIVTEIAKLKRHELREFKTRFQLSMQICRSAKFAQPFRFASQRTKCAYVFIPLEGKFLDHRRVGLPNLTFACKYELKLPKCIGISFAPENSGWFSVDWCYLESAWQYDKEMEERLKEGNPFRNVKLTEANRYNFRNQ